MRNPPGPGPYLDADRLRRFEAVINEIRLMVRREAGSDWAAADRILGAARRATAPEEIASAISASAKTPTFGKRNAKHEAEDLFFKLLAKLGQIATEERR